MSLDMKAILGIVATGAALTEEQAAETFALMMSGGATDAQIGAFLMALRVRGETVAEITGGARVMREKAHGIVAPEGAIDTCGTGGDAKGTLNISTGVAFVVAALGVPVAKHGNRALSSKSGAADVLRALGVNLDCAMPLVQRALDDYGICFMMAPRHHGAMKHVMPARIELATRTVFNLLGPLSNPARTKRQLLGVFAQGWVEPLALVLHRLGAEAAWVVHGSDGLDELTTTGPSFVAELKDGIVRSFEITPEQAGLPRATPESIRGGTPEHNAVAMHALLDGQTGAFRDIVLLNAAAALIVAGKVATLPEGVALAAQAIDSGKAKEKLAQLVAITNSEAATS
jgi:anthranilate phosphoribosyltransferase